MTKVWMVDPDSGWKYGFPKPAPDNYNLHDDFDFHEWLLSEGYPLEKIDYWLNSSFGYVPCRMWEQEIEDE
jgi:hypothetical protein